VRQQLVEPRSRVGLDADERVGEVLDRVTTFAEMDRRSGNCALCRWAELRQHLGWLRGMLTGRPV